jgi:carboxypeptidase Taq
MSAYEELMAYTKTTQAVSSVAGRTGWDQETVMPAGAAGLRAEEMAALEVVLHERRTSGQIGDWLEAAEGSETGSGEVAEANLRLIRRSYERATKIPADLASALARQASQGQGVWAQARTDEDFAGFAPDLEQMNALKRREAEALADGGALYDAMLDD